MVKDRGVGEPTQRLKQTRLVGLECKCDKFNSRHPIESVIALRLSKTITLYTQVKEPAKVIRRNGYAFAEFTDMQGRTYPIGLAEKRLIV